MTLINQQFKDDPRVAKAKEMLLEALSEHQDKLTGIRPADPALKESYQELLDDFAKVRGGKLWYPYIGSGIGNGALVELQDGSVKYDFISGIGVHYWGHSHPDLVAASIDSALTNTVMQGHLQQNIESYELCKMLTSTSGFDYCFLTSSGVMANENALKLIFQKKHPAQRILAFERCFMGRTLAISQMTDKPSFREGLPSNIHVDYIPFFEWSDPEGSTERAVNRLKSYLQRYPNQYAAMCFELVQGEGGFYPGNKKFFTALMEILRENDIAILADEVQTFGRTTQLFAFKYFGLEEYIDVLTIGKLAHICATLYKEKMKPKPGLLSQTFTSSTSAIFAAKTIISDLSENHYYGENGKIAQLHQHFVRNFEAIREKHPNLLQGPYGIGTMVAFTPLDGSAATAKKLADKLFEAGVIAFIAGSNPTRIRFLVPVGAVTEEDVDTVTGIIEKTLMDWMD